MPAPPYAPPPPIPIPPAAAPARPVPPSVRDKLAHLGLAAGCALGCVGAGWGAVTAASVGWDVAALAGSLLALVSAGGLVWAGWPLVLDIRHGLRDLTARDVTLANADLFATTQDAIVRRHARAVYRPPAARQEPTIGGQTRLERAVAQAVAQALARQPAAARYVPGPDAVPVARAPVVWQERVTERLPPQHTPYSADERQVVQWACAGLKVSQRPCEERGLPKGRWAAAAAALWSKGVLVKGERGEPYQLAPWATSAAIVARALTGEQ